MHDLYQHQLDALEYAMSRNSIALFMEMRLGKTVVAIRWAQAKARAGYKLVISPLETLVGWEKELRREGHACALLVGPTEQKMRKLREGWKDGVRWYLTNPEGLRVWPDLLGWGWNAVICDESTWLKSPKAKITKIMLECRETFYRCIMSGLPAPEGCPDLATQMVWAFGEFMGANSYWSWRQKYMVPSNFGWTPKWSTVKAVKAELRAKAHRCTRKKAGMFTAKVFEERYVEMPDHLKELSEKVEEEWVCGESMTKWSVVAGNWLCQVAAGIIPKDFDPSGQKWIDKTKVKAVADLLCGELKDSVSVVFGVYTRQIQALAKELKGRGIAVTVITGKDTVEERREKLDRFAKCGRVLILQQRVGRYGLDLSMADACVFMSWLWDCEVRSQCIERLAHMNKTEASLIVDVITRGSIEEHVVKILKEKMVDAREFQRMMTYKVEGTKMPW